MNQAVHAIQSFKYYYIYNKYLFGIFILVIFRFTYQVNYSHQFITDAVVIKLSASAQVTRLSAPNKSI